MFARITTARLHLSIFVVEDTYTIRTHRTHLLIADYNTKIDSSADTYIPACIYACVQVCVSKYA